MEHLYRQFVENVSCKLTVMQQFLAASCQKSRDSLTWASQSYCFIVTKYLSESFFMPKRAMDHLPI